MPDYVDELIARDIFKNASLANTSKNLMIHSMYWFLRDLCRFIDSDTDPYNKTPTEIMNVLKAIRRDAAACAHNAEDTAWTIMEKEMIEDAPRTAASQ